MESLVNFDGLGDVIVNLINKLAGGVGWIANKETPRKIAIKTYIEDIQNSNYDPVIKAALISRAEKTIKEYCNQNDILKIAIESLDETAKPEDVDDDWLNQFMDKARLVSDKEFQRIWGKILSEECNNVNSIPKSLLHILEQMDSKDALAFTAICSISVYVEEEGKDYSPILLASHLDDFYSKIGITYNSLVDLQALGLIEMNMGFMDNAYHTKYDQEQVIIQYFGKSYELPRGMNYFSVGNVIFTKAGQALCKAITVSEQEGFWEMCCIPIWQEDVAQYLNSSVSPCS